MYYRFFVCVSVTFFSLAPQVVSVPQNLLIYTVPLIDGCKFVTIIIGIDDDIKRSSVAATLRLFGHDLPLQCGDDDGGQSIWTARVFSSHENRSKSFLAALHFYHDVIRDDYRIDMSSAEDLYSIESLLDRVDIDAVINKPYS